MMDYISIEGERPLVKASNSNRTWTIAEAKARLSEILRLSETEGPQRIGARKSFIVVPAHVWAEKQAQRKHLGQWLVANTPRGTNLEMPSRSENGCEIPFID